MFQSLEACVRQELYSATKVILYMAAYNDQDQICELKYQTFSEGDMFDLFSQANKEFEGNYSIEEFYRKATSSYNSYMQNLIMSASRQKWPTLSQTRSGSKTNCYGQLQFYKDFHLYNLLYKSLQQKMNFCDIASKQLSDKDPLFKDAQQKKMYIEYQALDLQLRKFEKPVEESSYLRPFYNLRLLNKLLQYFFDRKDSPALKKDRDIERILKTVEYAKDNMSRLEKNLPEQIAFNFLLARCYMSTNQTEKASQLFFKQLQEQIKIFGTTSLPVQESVNRLLRMMASTDPQHFNPNFSKMLLNLYTQLYQKF